MSDGTINFLMAFLIAITGVQVGIYYAERRMIKKWNEYQEKKKRRTV